MATYILGEVRFSDPELYEKYTSGFPAVFAKFGGRVLAVDDAPVTLEGKANGERLVLLEFSDREAAERFWNSPEYRELAKYRHAAADSRILRFEGL
ncbi:DUF1330 domain-containing protein [Bradyrhizobium sp. 23AC]